MLGILNKGIIEWEVPPPLPTQALHAARRHAWTDQWNRPTDSRVYFQSLLCFGGHACDMYPRSVSRSNINPPRRRSEAGREGSAIDHVEQQKSHPKKERAHDVHAHGFIVSSVFGNEEGSRYQANLAPAPLVVIVNSTKVRSNPINRLVGEYTHFRSATEFNCSTVIFDRVDTRRQFLWIPFLRCESLNERPKERLLPRRSRFRPPRPQTDGATDRFDSRPLHRALLTSEDRRKEGRNSA